jgi:hypothetical protein
MYIQNGMSLGLLPSKGCAMEIITMAACSTSAASALTPEWRACAQGRFGFSADQLNQDTLSRKAPFLACWRPAETCIAGCGAPAATSQRYVGNFEDSAWNCHNRGALASNTGANGSSRSR